MKKYLSIVFTIALLLLADKILAQKVLKGLSDENPNAQNNTQYNNNKGTVNNTKKPDSLQHRDAFADSITITFRYFDSLKYSRLDSSLSDFSKRLQLPYYYNTLGNFGTAAQSLLFNPLMKAGFDAGFHQFDVYNYTLSNTKFFQTTRPYSELGYLLGKNAEQVIDVLHTQNRNENINFSVEYRFSNSPGVFQNQSANHNNLRAVYHYEAPRRRFHFFAVYIGTKNASSENGGVKDIHQLDSLSINNPFELETRLGTSTTTYRNLFNTTINTGNTYVQNQWLLRGQYDLGQKDSVMINDTTKRYLFYPRLRFQLDLSTKTSSYQFKDDYADSISYKNYFNYRLDSIKQKTISFRDAYKEWGAAFSIISFPDKKNQGQFLKPSIGYQNIAAVFADTNRVKLYNIYGGIEYRNRTKNNIWDIDANGKLYLNGLNSGDYEASVSLQRQLSKKNSYLQVAFNNINKSPSFIYSPLTGFPVKNKQSFSKENITKLSALYTNPALGFSLSANYFLLSNYLYFDSFFTAKQEATLINVLQIGAEKSFRLAKHFNWYAQLNVQQATNNIVQLPHVLIRNRFAFEGTFYKNLSLSTGIEIVYNSNFSPNNYSPIIGQFFTQHNFTTANLPEIHAYFHFRIKSFKAYLRAENLNTLFASGSKQYNYLSSEYPQAGVWLRLGIWWSFVN